MNSYFCHPSFISYDKVTTPGSSKFNFCLKHVAIKQSYCNVCEVLVCPDCSCGHYLISSEDAFQKAKRNNNRLNNEAKCGVSSVKLAMDYVNYTSKEIENSTDQMASDVRNVIRRTISALEQKECEFMEVIKLSKQQKTKALSEQLQELSLVLSHLVDISLTLTKSMNTLNLDNITLTNKKSEINLKKIRAIRPKLRPCEKITTPIAPIDTNFLYKISTIATISLNPIELPVNKETVVNENIKQESLSKTNNFNLSLKEMKIKEHDKSPPITNGGDVNENIKSLPLIAINKLQLISNESKPKRSDKLPAFIDEGVINKHIESLISTKIGNLVSKETKLKQLDIITSGTDEDVESRPLIVTNHKLVLEETKLKQPDVTSDINMVVEHIPLTSTNNKLVFGETKLKQPDVTSGTNEDVESRYLIGINDKLVLEENKLMQPDKSSSLTNQEVVEEDAILLLTGTNHLNLYLKDNEDKPKYDSISPVLIHHDDDISTEIKFIINDETFPPIPLKPKSNQFRKMTRNRVKLR